MKKFSVLLLPFFALLLAASQPKITPMPVPLTGNAVVSIRGGLEIYSLMGIGPKKTWDDVTNRVYVFHLRSDRWIPGQPVPGVAGRVGAAAIVARGHVYVFGGFSIDGKGNEIINSDVNAYAPEDHRWYRAADIPVPVDNAVIGVDRDRYIYLVGGRSKNGPVNNVQVYDVEQNLWHSATPSPGPPVFGHAGGLTDDAIVYVDGAMKNPAAGAPYIASQESWIGKIDHKDPNQIEWTKLPAHPGPAHFGIVGGAAEKGKIVFTGGTETPHDYKGVAYDGHPSEPSPVTFTYSVHGNHWDVISEHTADPRMDCRGVVSTVAGPVVVGGMVSGSEVSADATLLPQK